MNQIELKQRTKTSALRCIALAESLPPTRRCSRAIADQLIRAASSVGANYRAACRGRSKAEFLSKMGVVEEETDESAFWLEMIVDGNLKESRLVAPLRTEAEEILRIVVASINTARGGARIKSAIRNPKSAI